MLSAQAPVSEIDAYIAAATAAAGLDYRATFVNICLPSANQGLVNPAAARAGGAGRGPAPAARGRGRGENSPGQPEPVIGLPLGEPTTTPGGGRGR